MSLFSQPRPDVQAPRRLRRGAALFCERITIDNNIIIEGLHLSAAHRDGMASMLIALFDQTRQTLRTSRQTRMWPDAEYTQQMPLVLPADNPTEP